LTDHQKQIFKTFGEISQKEIVIQASQRQKYIDQAQSLNLMISPSCSPKEVSTLLIEGWQLGIKTFYYQRSANPAQELARSILNCASCES
jgi:ribonucleoside-diphosphate reductase alpha chain